MLGKMIRLVAAAFAVVGVSTAAAQEIDSVVKKLQATNSITAGWGGPQAISGPVLVIPYRASATETVVQNGQSVTHTSQVAKNSRSPRRRSYEPAARQRNDRHPARS